MNIAVMALQGAFVEHEKILARLGVDFFEIRQLSDWLRPKDALIIPGGESTTMLKLLNDMKLLNPIREDINGGLPVFGTCAGLIMLSKHVEGDDIQRISSMNITTCRNAYGRQLGSFFAKADFKGIGKVPMTFIRAPYIKKVGDGVEILSQVDGHIVAACQKNQLVTAFHPELDDDIRIHQFFLNMIK